MKKIKFSKPIVWLLIAALSLLLALTFSACSGDTIEGPRFENENPEDERNNREEDPNNDGGGGFVISDRIALLG